MVRLFVQNLIFSEFPLHQIAQWIQNVDLGFAICARTIYIEGTEPPGELGGKILRGTPVEMSKMEPWRPI